MFPIPKSHDTTGNFSLILLVHFTTDVTNDIVTKHHWFFDDVIAKWCHYIPNKQLLWLNRHLIGQLGNIQLLFRKVGLLIMSAEITQNEPGYIRKLWTKTRDLMASGLVKSIYVWVWH